VALTEHEDHYLKSGEKSVSGLSFWGKKAPICCLCGTDPEKTC
jgi:hypothetical protein